MRVAALSILSLFLFLHPAFAEKDPRRPFLPSAIKSGSESSELNHLRQSGDTLWLQVYTPEDAGPCVIGHGGECSGGPDHTQTFSFERFGQDPKWAYYGSDGTHFSQASGNGFRTEDVRAQPSPDDSFYWHLDTYQAYNPGGYSWWCGTLTGSRCENWGDAPGYGDEWNQFLTLSPSLYSSLQEGEVSPGDSVYLDCWVRYDIECDYDYAYIKYSNDGGTTWNILAQLNGTSGNPDAAPCGQDYFGNDNHNQGNPPGIQWQQFPLVEANAAMAVGAGGQSDFLVGFQFISDGAWSDQDGDNTDGALNLDEVEVYWYPTWTGVKARETLEYENMDADFEAGKWSMIRPAGIADLWAVWHDPDPPLEMIEGATICEENASWMWAAAPYLNGAWRIPTAANGFYYRLVTPSIYMGWGEPDIPKDVAGLVHQYDLFSCRSSQTCDKLGLRIREYKVGAGGWCDWQQIWTFMEWEASCDPFFVLDWTNDFTYEISTDADSVQFAWDAYDTGDTGDYCWTMAQPHRKTQLLVDNVSFGLYDRSETFFHARVIDLFQDTFHLYTNAHNALCANGDMPIGAAKTLDWSESLVVDIHDMNGLETSGHVKLFVSDDDGATWSSVNMVLKFPNPDNPDLGGTYIGSVRPAQVYGSGTQWVPGTVVWYYIEAKDDDGNYAYWPRTAAPGHPPPTRPWYSNYFEFSILPGSGELYEAPNRLLLVDDFGRTEYDYSPAMTESTVAETEDIYEGVIYDLAYCWDKYDVNGASTGLSNEPWGILTADPVEPDSIIRQYDAVIWFTSRFDEYTVMDTMQCVLRDFVMRGGNLFICGNHIGADMTNHGLYDDDAADTCSFYESLLGAAIGIPAKSSPGIHQPHSWAVGTGAGGLTDQDTFHFHQGCPISVQHDLIRVNSTPSQPWSNPDPYLVYHTGYDPGDTLVAIYNDIGGPGTGKVVYMALDLAAIVDSSGNNAAGGATAGRKEIMTSVLTNLFGMTPFCFHY